MRRQLVSALAALALSACGSQPLAPAASAVSEAGLVAAARVAEAPRPDAHAPVAERVKFALDRHDQGRYDEAAADLLSLSDAAPLARALAARSLLEADRLQEAYEAAVRVVREVPNAPLAHFALGWVAAREGRHDEAREAYLRVLDLVPNDAAAWNNLGSLDYMREDFYNARWRTEQALKFSDDDLGRAIAEANLGELDLLQGREADAEAHYDRALELSPETPHAYYELAAFYDLVGRHDAALTMADLGASLDPLGASRRSMSFVWPELELHHDAIVAEARGDVAGARKLWTSLLGIEQSKTGLHLSGLKGRAAEHLASLGDGAWVNNLVTAAQSAGSDDGQPPAFMGNFRSDAVLNGVTQVVEQERQDVATVVEVYQGYGEFERSQPEPPHKCD